MNMRKIDKSTLQNGGMFVARGAMAYDDKNGIKHISVVSLCLAVVAGANNETTQSFIFRKASTVGANYTINGLTMNNALGLMCAERFP